MQNWLAEILNSGQFALIGFPAAFLLGLSTFTSAAGCCVPAAVIVAGYTGAQENQDRRRIFITAGAFFLASVVSLSAAGAIISLFGQTLSSELGFYGEVVIGLIAVFFGSAALGFLPFSFPGFKPAARRLPKGLLGITLLGLTLGFASTACSITCCAPVQLPLVLGMAAVRGEVFQGSLILALFAVGYSLPLVLLVAGLSLGKTSRILTKIARPLRLVSGIILIIMGLWIILP